MIMLLWTLPVWVMLGGIASGRVSTSLAATAGLITAIVVAMLSGPAGMNPEQLAQALQRGGWIGLNITPYILGGLAFWQIAAPGMAASSPPAPGTATIPEPASAQPGNLRPTGNETTEANPPPPDHPPSNDAHADETRGAFADAANAGTGQPSSGQRRQHLFLACFLIGPFAESATGFGAGMLGTIMLLRPLGLAPVPLMIFGLLSQTMIPWGGMGSSTLLASAYAGLPPEQLGTWSTLPIALLMLLVWLPLFWHTADQAGLGVPHAWRSELVWTAAGLVLAGMFTWHLGPETGLLASHGLLAALHYLWFQRPDRPALRQMIGNTLPYLLLTLVLVTTRAWTPLKETLSVLLLLQPWPDLPGLAPFFHAGCLMMLGCLIIAVLKQRVPRLPEALKDACQTGSQPILTVFLFSMMAEVLSSAGISRAYADGLFTSLGAEAILATPAASALFGVLASSANASNSLFMASVVTLGIKLGLSLPLLAALQHASGASMSLFSPVRMSMAARLCDGSGQERQVYRMLLPYGAGAMLILLGCAVGVYGI